MCELSGVRGSGAGLSEKGIGDARVLPAAAAAVARGALAEAGALRDAARLCSVAARSSRPMRTNCSAVRSVHNLPVMMRTHQERCEQWLQAAASLMFGMRLTVLQDRRRRWHTIRMELVIVIHAQQTERSMPFR
jgi:hypothetical protein